MSSRFYVATGGDDEYLVCDVQTWIEDSGHMVASAQYDWRPLEPHQTAARDCYLLGVWFTLKKRVKGEHRVDQLPDADPAFINLCKLRWPHQFPSWDHFVLTPQAFFAGENAQYRIGDMLDWLLERGEINEDFGFLRSRLWGFKCSKLAMLFKLTWGGS